MIWFDIKKLEEKLIKNEISERTGYHYLLAFLIIMTLVIGGKEPADFTGESLRSLDVIIGIIFTIWGTGKVFKINNEGGNQDFLKKYFSLCFVHTLRIAVAVFFVVFIYNLMIEFIFTDHSEVMKGFIKNDISNFVSNLLFQIVFYFLLIRSFKKINLFSENKAVISS